MYGALADLRGAIPPPPALKNIHSLWPFFTCKQFLYQKKILASFCSPSFFILKLKTGCKKQSTALINIIFYKYTTTNSDKINHILEKFHYFYRNSSTIHNSLYSSKMRNWRSAMEVNSSKWLCLLTFSHYVKMWLPAKDTQVQDIANLQSSFLKNLFLILRNFFNRKDFFYWSLHKFPFCLLLYFKASVQFLLLYCWAWDTRSKFWCSLPWHSENKEFHYQIFQRENTGSSVETQGNFSKIGLISWQIIPYQL